ncbi:hypothetical protein C824_003597 [Schaedlerella arabinosiphila]|nr:hypothetical protein C824_003597 [Schaedlerella arabinosiphila]
MDFVFEFLKGQIYAFFVAKIAEDILFYLYEYTNKIPLQS